MLACAGSCGGGSSPTAPTGGGPVQVTLAGAIEALFLSTGPLGTGEGCFMPGVFSSYRRGSQVRIVVGSTVSQARRQAIMQAVADLNEAVGGYYSLSYTESAVPTPSAGPFEITVADLGEEEMRRTCGFYPGGCLINGNTSGPFIISSQAFQSDNSATGAALHEVGHGLGFCHFSSARLAGSVMVDAGPTPDRFIALELDAIRAVYASGIEPGSTRADFVAAGLLQ